MTCDHRFIVQACEGRGKIVCKRCGDVRQDGLNLDPKQEEAEEWVRWQRKKQNSPIWTPPNI